MRIAVDCRYLGKSGIGRVCEGVLDALDFAENEYFLIGDRRKLEKYEGAHIVEDDTEPYSVAGLRSFDRSLNERCDALFIPNFLVPFGVKIPVHIVMHDLAFLDVKETTRGVFDRMIKRTLLRRGITRAKTVACVSAFTRSRCEHYYKERAKKCYTNYIGISENVFSYARTHAAEKGKDIVFVGNVKPHKGLTLLLDAFSGTEEGTLRIIGERENFRTRLDLPEKAYERVVFTGKLTDEEMFREIARAKFLVLPSRYEGFGLPPLEALVLGTQPIVSDIPVFREVYAGLPVLFFEGTEDLAAKLRGEPTAVDCAGEIAARYRYDLFTKELLQRIGGAAGAVSGDRIKA